jgi:hypothetical protein
MLATMTLDPGERVELKRRVVETLGEQEWPDIDLILEEFGFPTEEEWHGSSRPSYVQAMLKHQPDDRLVQLDGYLHPSAVPPADPPPAAFDDPLNPWAGTGLRLFLSHHHKQAEKAGELRAELAKRLSRSP